MPVFVEFPVDGRDTTASSRVRAVLTEIFGVDRRVSDGDYSMVRTWDTTGAECVRLAIDAADSAAETKRVRRAVTGHGFTPTIREATSDEIPSSLWNAGFDGPAFNSVSTRLARATAPLLVRLAADLPKTSKDGYPVVLAMLAAHSAATLVESEQRRLQGHDFADLYHLRLLSYRSHFEGVFARATDPDTFERRFAAYYDRFGAQTRDLVRARLDEPVPPAGEPAGDWAHLVLKHFDGVRNDASAGLIVNQSITLDELNRGREIPLPPTRFHKPLSPAMEQLLHHNPDFLAFRLLTSLLYSSLYTLGFNLLERYLFCYLLARANEDVSGRSTADLQAGLRSLADELAPDTIEQLSHRPLRVGTR